MRGKHFAENQIVELQRQITELERKSSKVLGAYRQLERDMEVLREDNRRLLQALVDAANRKPTVIEAPQVDVSAILDGIKRIVAPDIVVDPGRDSPDIQRNGVDWGDQGLDNNGGVREYSRKDVDRVSGERDAIPDYVLDIENLTDEQIKGARGGWYNPPPLQNQASTGGMRLNGEGTYSARPTPNI